jgi:hypothetical protein
MHISLTKFIITVGDETGPCSRVYVVGYAGFSVCQAMSVSALKYMLSMFIHKMEAPEGEGWSLGSLSGWFGGAARPVSQSDVRSMRWVTLEISLVWWAASPLQPRVVVPLYDMGCMAPQPFAAGGTGVTYPDRSVFPSPIMITMKEKKSCLSTWSVILSRCF